MVQIFPRPLRRGWASDARQVRLILEPGRVGPGPSSHRTRVGLGWLVLRPLPYPTMRAYPKTDLWHSRPRLCWRHPHSRGRLCHVTG